MQTNSSISATTQLAGTSVQSMLRMYKSKNLARPASKKNTSASAGFSNYRGGQSHDFSRGGVRSEHFDFSDHFKSVTYQLTDIRSKRNKSR